MAGVKLQMPQFMRNNAATSAQIISFLYQLTDQLQYALNNLDTENFSEQGRKELNQYTTAAKNAVVKLNDEQAATFNKLRSDIVKTATEIRNDYKKEISESVGTLSSSISETYVAKSEGDTEGTVAELKEHTKSEVAQSANTVRLEFSKTAEIAQQTKDNFNSYKTTSETYIHFGFDGIEIGKMKEDKTLPYSVRINNEKMSFLQSGVEVAYIMYNKLYITAIEVLDRLSIGSKAMGGFFDLDTSELGAGWLWRDE